ncbi:MAG TPA: ferrous iron transport protein A [Piscirickettsiaceae bacterium]|nr:ferrous iron transport protein A [Piscirickettsiaceae bacterium]HIQ39919.1 ferrous iron transport protein A [Sulfurivirga caldicuralii]
MDINDKRKQTAISDLCALSQCPVGSECEICSLRGHPSERLRLLNLGFQRSSQVKLMQVRNNHYIVSVDGSRFALSKQLANSIEVRPKQAV